VEEFATFLQNREPADLLDEVRSFARRRPGTFLLGAALAGVLAGRLTSGVKAAHADHSGSSQLTSTQGTYGQDTYGQGTYTEGTYGQSAYAGSAPAYSGYESTTTGTTTGYETTTPGYEQSPSTPGTPLPPPPYGTTPPAGSVVPPAAPAGWDDPARRPGQGV
jgi:hypothetical protein